MTREPSNSALCARAFLRGLPVAILAAAATMAVISKDLRLVGVSAFAVNWYWVGSVSAAASGVRVGWLDGQRICFSWGASLGSMLIVWLLR